MNRKPVFYKKFSSNDINFLMQLVDRNDVIKNWNTLKHEYDLQNKLYFQYVYNIATSFLFETQESLLFKKLLQRNYTGYL